MLEMDSRAQEEALSDCWVIAAESFCGMEQTTTRVEPVEHMLEPRMRLRADNIRVMTIWMIMEFQYGSLLRIWTHFDGTMSSMCNGCRRLSVGVLMPRVLCPMAMAM